MKVYDCFTFYCQFELLELRLKSLYDLVDYFVIVESNKTFSNKSKPFNFLERKDEFKEFFPKIRYVMEKDNIPFRGPGDWAIEANQRNNIMRGLEDAQPDDLIFISDLDEFPSPDILERIYKNWADVTMLCYTPPPNFAGRCN